MRKLIERELPTYFIFGKSDDGKYVDVSNGNGDVLTHVKIDEADKIIKDRDELISIIEFMCRKYDTSYEDLASIIHICCPPEC